MNSDWRDPSEAVSCCCFCGKIIDDNTPVYALGARARPGVDISKYEGGAMPVQLLAQEKPVYAVVPSADSEAKKQGSDFMFVFCSRECASELKGMLQHDVDLGKMIEGIDEL